MLRAFAGSTAAVVRSLFRDGRFLIQAFQDFVAISGPHLLKAFIILLWPANFDVMKSRVVEHLQGCETIGVAWSSAYLGFMEGPGKGDRS